VLVWRSFKRIEKEEYIFFFFVANEWLGYCIVAVGLILNMEKSENIWILVQVLCHSLIGTVAIMPPQLPCQSVTLANTAAIMLTKI
jgi:hypothetical protein